MQSFSHLLSCVASCSHGSHSKCNAQTARGIKQVLAHELLFISESFVEIHSELAVCFNDMFKLGNRCAHILNDLELNRDRVTCEETTACKLLTMCNYSNGFRVGFYRRIGKETIRF